MSHLPPLRAGFLGTVDYDIATNLQHKIRDDVLEGRSEEHLLLLEHPHVLTLGRNAAADDVLADRKWLEEQGVMVRDADRGGQVTYHGPGQLVGYPILDLKPDRRDVRRYIRDLQEVLIRSLADLGIDADPGLDGAPVGVWVEGEKIASIGVHIRRWVTTHGFALNVSTDLDYFKSIVACGMPGTPVSSVAEQSRSRAAPSCRSSLSLAELSTPLIHHFCTVFGRTPLPLALEGDLAERASAASNTRSISPFA